MDRIDFMATSWEYALKDTYFVPLYGLKLKFEEKVAQPRGRDRGMATVARVDLNADFIDQFKSAEETRTGAKIGKLLVGRIARRYAEADGFCVHSFNAKDGSISFNLKLQAQHCGFLMIWMCGFDLTEMKWPASLEWYMWENSATTSFVLACINKLFGLPIVEHMRPILDRWKTRPSQDFASYVGARGVPAHVLSMLIQVLDMVMANCVHHTFYLELAFEVLHYRPREGSDDSSDPMQLFKERLEEISFEVPMLTDKKVYSTTLNKILFGKDLPEPSAGSVNSHEPDVSEHSPEAESSSQAGDNGNGTEQQEARPVAPAEKVIRVVTPGWDLGSSSE